MIPTGTAEEPYIVAVRELESASLAQNQRTWINQHLTFTHGNGFVAAPATTVTPDGYPVFTVSDTSQQGEIPVAQPRIYFGKLIENKGVQVLLEALDGAGSLVASLPVKARPPASPCPAGTATPWARAASSWSYRRPASSRPCIRSTTRGWAPRCRVRSTAKW